MTRISSAPGQPSVSEDAAALDQLASAQQKTEAKDQGKVPAKNKNDKAAEASEKKAESEEKLAAQKQKLAAMLKPELDALLKSGEFKGDMFALLLASSEQKLEELPKGASKELVAQLQKMSEALPSEPPTKIPEAFNLDIEGLSLPQLFKAPHEVGGFLAATQTIEGGAKHTWEKNNPRLELVKAYAKLLHAAHDKLEQKQQTAQQISQIINVALREKLEKAAPEIAKIYKGYLEKSFLDQKKLVATGSANSLTQADEDIEIPSPDMVQLERIFKEVGPLLRDAKIIEDKNEYRVAMRRVWQAYSSDDTAVSNDGEAAVATEGDAAGGSGSSDSSGTEASADGSAGANAGNGPPPPITPLGGIIPQYVPPLPVDIESLIIVVMMNATKVESDILTDQLHDMQKITAKKKQLREVKTKARQESARLDAAMREEFNTLKASGQIHSTIKYEDYKAWRQCQWGDVREDAQGNLVFSDGQLEDPIPLLPDWMIYGTESAEAAKESEQATGAAAEYGLPSKVTGMLKQLWEHMPEPRPATFEEYLNSLDMWPIEKVPDDIETNLALAAAEIQKYAAEHPPADVEVMTVAEMQRRDAGSIYELMVQYTAMQVLAAAGVPVDMTGIQKDLNEALAKPVNAEDKEAIMAEMAKISTEANAEVAKQVEALRAAYEDFKNGPNQSKPDDTIKEWDYSEGDWDEEQAPNDMEWDEAYSLTMGWGPGPYEDGESYYTGFQFGDGGASGYGMGVEYNVDDTAALGRWDVDTSGFGMLLDLMGSNTIGGTGGPTKSDIDKKAIGAIEAMEAFLAGDPEYAYDPEVAATGVDEAGNPIIDPEDLTGFEAYITDLLGQLDDQSGPYWNWVEGKDFDGKAEQRREQEQQDEEAARAAQAASNQKEAAGKPRGADGVILENQGNLEQFDAFVQEIDDKLASLSEMGEIEMIRMQALVDRRAKFIEALSNLIAKEGKLRETINSNLK